MLSYMKGPKIDDWVWEKVMLLEMAVSNSMACHGSKGPWLEVSTDVTCSAQVLSVFTRRREGSQGERSRLSWIGDKVETEVSMLSNYSLNTTTP
jgi:hypothetical protein